MECTKFGITRIHISSKYGSVHRARIRENV